MRRNAKRYYKIEHYRTHEYTSNMLYEFFLRTLDNGEEDIKNFEILPFKYNKLQLKDIVIYESSHTKLTLQDIVYNIYPDLYKNLMEDSLIKDKLNFSMELIDFEEQIKDLEFKNFIYKDLNENEYITFTKELMEKEISKIKLFGKYDIDYGEKGLDLDENMFINIYNLNLALPSNEISAYIEEIKKKYFKNRKKEKELKYKSYIYKPDKLADILFVYDQFRDNDDINKIERIQFDILLYRHNAIEIIDCDDIDKFNISETTAKKVNDEINKLQKLIKATDEDMTHHDIEIFETEDIEEIRKSIKTINQLIDNKYKNKLVKYIPFLSKKTIYTYYNIAKYYIDDKNYTTLLNQA